MEYYDRERIIYDAMEWLIVSLDDGNENDFSFDDGDNWSSDMCSETY
jgi:hypothetical protein